MTANTVTVHAMHCSMQFSDNTKQKQSDAKKLLDRAAERGVLWLTGTEAGAGQSLDLRSALRHESDDHGFHFWMHPSSDSWISVNRKFGCRLGLEVWFSDILVPARARRNTAKRLIGVGFDTNIGIGHVGVSACHYMTKGRPDAHSPEYREFLDDNQAIAAEIGRRARIEGAGSDLFFYAGDQNIVDKFNDTFLGRAKMTSTWDELKKYENTGHGNIDVIASYDHDGRVEAKYVRALDDKEFHLHTDHFLVETGFNIRTI